MTLIFFGYALGNIIKSISGNFEIFAQDKPSCYLLRNEECKVRKVIIINDYMTFPYNILVDKCVGSCNDKENPCFKVFLPDSVKNICVKSFDLLSKKNVLKNISLHKSCKCDCLLDEKVCNNKQKWNKEKCRCECLKEEKCSDDSYFNVINCSCEMEKAAKLIVEEKCKEINDDINYVIQNETITLIKKIENCKLFIGVSILFLCISIILTGIMIYFCLKSRKNNALLINTLHNW